MRPDQAHRSLSLQGIGPAAVGRWHDSVSSGTSLSASDFIIAMLSANCAALIFQELKHLESIFWGDLLLRLALPVWGQGKI